MARKHDFYWKCFARAWKGTFDLANAWAPVLGLAVFGGIVYGLSGHAMGVPETFSQLLFFALACVGAAWVVIFLYRLINAPAQLWLEERKRVENLEAERNPKLSLEYRPDRDACAVRTSATPQRPKTWYYRIRPRVLSDAAVKGCRGQLVKIVKFENDNWVRAPYTDPRILRWVNYQFAPIDLHAGISQMLDMFYVNGKGELHLGDESESMLGAIGEESNYRFEFVVTAENCPLCSRIIEVKHSGKWEQPQISEVSTP